MKKTTEKNAPLQNRERPILATHILFASFGDGGVIFNIKTRESNHLNASAASIISLLQNSRTVKEIAAVLSKGNRVRECEIKTDVKDFLEDLTCRGWIDGG